MSQGSRSTFGKYTLLRKLASGGMGEVFLAKQRGPSGFEKLLVIKRILSHHLDKRDYLDMFFSEAKLVARLNHNNIIQIQEMGEIDGDYYIAMEYVRGKSLRDVIDELRAEGRVLPLPHVIDLAIKLCEGLGYAHQARDIRGRPMNIVHRDINPHNVLISYNGDLKLIDFGIAKSEMTSVHTATGTIKGKFVYMSPEQSAADPIDRRSDIFSLGIVLYEMTVLENPFVRQNVVLSLEAIQRHAIPPPSSKRPDAGPMDAILQKALEKKPEERYQTATEMRDDLRNLFRNGLVTPSEEDISVFLHDLFSGDIDEEDRLLAEADRATSPPLAIQEVDPRGAFELAVHPKALDVDQLHKAAGLIAAPHSSDLEPANPVKGEFADEEPTLSGNLQALEKMSREVSSRSSALQEGAVQHAGEHADEEPRPQGQVMTLIAPDEVVPGTGEEMLPELPTRSDRVPRNSSPRSSPNLAASSSLPLSLAGANGLIPASGPVPNAAIGNQGSFGAGPKTPGPHTFGPPLNGDAQHGSLGMPYDEGDDDPVLAEIARSKSDEERPGAPPTIVPPFRSTIPEEPALGLVRPNPRLRNLGLAIAGVLVFAATAVAGFVATRAVTRPPGGLRAQPIEPAKKATDDSAVEKTPLTTPLPQQAKSATVAARTEERLPERSPDPKPDTAGEEKAEKRQKSAVPGAQPEHKPRIEDDKKRKEEERRKKEDDRREPERRRKDEEAAARKAIAEAKKTADTDRAPPPDGTKSEVPRRKVVVPQDASKESTKESKDSKDTTTPEDKDTPPIPRHRVASDSNPPADGVVPRFGTLTVSTSLEVSVEVDGKSVGTSPSVIAVRKGSGKIKLFGSNVDYAVTLNYKVEDEGISVKLDASPWAIAKHNGLSLGKTPQSVKAEGKHRFSLLRPGQHAPLVISLLWNPKNE